MKFLALIPARGGSKEVPGKNIKPIAGKPLIAWTIEQAINTDQIDRVIVSTDSSEIADISIQYGAQVPFIRPKTLSGDNATTESAMIHALHWLQKHENYQPDATILLQCTSPVRDKHTIGAAIKKYEKEKLDSLLSVTPSWYFLWTGGKPPKALYDFQNRPMRQNISEDDVKYKENGSIYISNCEGLMSFGNRLFGKIGQHIMPESQSFEIDSELDFQIVEILLKHLIKTENI